MNGLITAQIAREISMSFEMPEWLKYDIKRKRERLGLWWKDLAVRKWVNENPVFVMAITGASVLLLSVVIVWLVRPEHVPKVAEYKKEWYYDLNTGELFIAKKGLTPPIEAPSGPLPDGGPAGVRAYVLSHVDEPNEAEHLIAFIEIATSNGSRAIVLKDRLSSARPSAPTKPENAPPTISPDRVFLFGDFQNCPDISSRMSCLALSRGPGRKVPAAGLWPPPPNF